VLIVGERINATNKRIAQAIQEKDADFIRKEAMAQVEAGADYIDVNAVPFREKEIEYLEWPVTAWPAVTMNNVQRKGDFAWFFAGVLVISLV